MFGGGDAEDVLAPRSWGPPVVLAGIGLVLIAAVGVEIPAAVPGGEDEQRVRAGRVDLIAFEIALDLGEPKLPLTTSAPLAQAYSMAATMSAFSRLPSARAPAPA